MKNPILSSPQPFDRNMHCESNYIQVDPGMAVLIRDYTGEQHVFFNNVALTRMQLWRFRKSAQVYTVTTSLLKIQVPLQACRFREGTYERSFDGTMNLEIKVTNPALFFAKYADTAGNADAFVSGISSFVRDCVMNNIFANQRRHMQSVVMEFSAERHNALAANFETNGIKLLHSSLSFAFKRQLNNSAASHFREERHTDTHRSANRSVNHANRNTNAEHKHTARPLDQQHHAAVKPVQLKRDADMKNEGFMSLEELMNKAGANSMASGS